MLGHGIVGVENLGGDLDKVAGKRFRFFCFPIRWYMGDGSMVRCVAEIDEADIVKGVPDRTYTYCGTGYGPVNEYHAVTPSTRWPTRPSRLLLLVRLRRRGVATEEVASSPPPVRRRGAFSFQRPARSNYLSLGRLCYSPTAADVSISVRRGGRSQKVPGVARALARRQSGRWEETPK